MHGSVLTAGSLVSEIIEGLTDLSGDSQIAVLSKFCSLGLGIPDPEEFWQ